jgi:hypothetical protein
MRLLLAAMLLQLAAPAHAARRGDGAAGNDELAIHIGYQAGFAGLIANPAGFKLFGEYAHRLGGIAWFELQVNQVFGFAPGSCIDARGNPSPCDPRLHGYDGGWATEIAAGVQLKIPTGIPLFVEVPIVAGIVALYNRRCGDDGVAAPVVRFGAGVKYFVTPHVGLGGGVNLALGPGFHRGTDCANAYVDLYAAFDFQVGVEFVF